MLRNLQQIIDLQFLSLSEENPKIIDVFVVWDGDVSPECDRWSKCKRWNGIRVKTMNLYKSEKGPRYRVNFDLLFELLAERDYRDVIYCSLDRPTITKNTPMTSMDPIEQFNFNTFQEW